MPVIEQPIPHVSLILPLSANEADARQAADDMIRNGLQLKSFEIVHVELVEEGMIQTPRGVRKGRRYLVAFHRTEGDVVYTHPNYKEILSNPFG